MCVGVVVVGKGGGITQYNKRWAMYSSRSLVAKVFGIGCYVAY